MLLVALIRTLLLAVLLVQVPGTEPPKAQEPVAQKSERAEAPFDAETVEKVRQLGAMLSSPAFEQRQKATRELWQMGPEILPELEKLAARSRGEAQIRLQDLVLFARCKVGFDESDSVIECVAGFLEQEYTVQRRALLKLCYLEKRDIAFRLLELVEDKSTKTKLQKVCASSSNDAKKALHEGDLEKFEKWILETGSQTTYKPLYYYWRWTRGELDEEVNKLKEKIKPELEAGAKYREQLEKSRKKKKAGKQRKKDKANKPDQPPQEFLRELIGLLRFQGKVEEAEQYADKLVDEEQRRRLTHTILMESSNWKKLQTLIVSKDKDCLLYTSDAADE